MIKHFALLQIPEENSVAEGCNRMLMNMVRGRFSDSSFSESLLFKFHLPCLFIYIFCTSSLHIGHQNSQPL